MKKFIVDTGNKKYKVEANTYDEAVSAVKAIQLKDEASPLQTVNALLEDERAAVDAYNVALENLKGKIPDESYAAIEAIRNDENRHIENLQAVVNGNVTEKNLEDSVKDGPASPDTELDRAHINYDGYDEPIRGKHYFEFDDKSDAEKAKTHLSRVGYNPGNVITKRSGSDTYYVLQFRE